ncbi:MAG: hypothetical protein JWQ20_2865 [Conexibacter sp.]|nr:hypothetical protein [Conexibacter sp.]
MPREMKRCLALVAVSTLALVLAGCGGNSNGPHSYLGKADNAAVYIAWNRDGDEVTGTLTQALRDDSQNKVTTQRIGFAGHVKDSGITLNLSEEFGSVATLSGRFDGDKLDLDYSGSDDGSIVTVHFKTAAANDYNKALAALRGQAADAQAAAQQAADDETTREDAQQLTQQVVSDLETVNGMSFSDAASTYEDGLQTLRTDLATVKEDFGAVQTDASGPDRDIACSDAETASSDVDTIRSDIDTLQNDIQTAASDPSPSDAIKTLRQNYASLQSFAAEFRPGNVPTPEEVDAAVSNARAIVRKIKTAGKTTLGQANAILGEAKGYDAQAQAICQRVGE